jgi:carboxypeptidase PM20D1
MSVVVTAIIALAAIVVALILTAVVRALATPRPAPRTAPLPESVIEEAAGIEEKLAAAVRYATVSSYRREEENDGAFSDFKEGLKGLFPNAHAGLERREIGDRALLFAWKGSDAALPPAILCAHFDVVPADDAAEWRHGPFSGDIADGEVWGRGAQDIKVMLVSALFAAERLLAEGHRPRRTIYFAFGGDEEVGGNRGAGQIAKELARMGVKASFLLDEGGPIAQGMLSFADRPLALVGVAEKGYADVLVVAEGKGGHASMPPRRTATGDLARAIAAVEAKPFPIHLSFTVRKFLEKLSPFVSFPYRLLFRNLWLTAPVVKAAFSAAPTTSAMIRTTAAPTMLSGSPKENVLADRAWANVNLRILPGENVSGVLERMSRIVAPFGVKARPHHPEELVEPLPESPVDHEGFRAIEAALAASFPEAAAVPFLFSAGTDTKHYRQVAEAIYRLTPLVQTGADLEGVHGRDERVSVANLRRCALFYLRLLASL